MKRSDERDEVKLVTGERGQGMSTAVLKLDPCQEARGWERMHPKKAKREGHLKCDSCVTNYKFTIDHKKDVIVDGLSGDIIAVCMDGKQRREE